MTEKTQTNGQEIAQGIDKLIDDLTVKPTRFAPNIGKCYVQFNNRQRLIKITAEATGEFVMEFDVAIQEFADDPERAFADVRHVVSETIMAGLQRRRGEQRLLADVMKEMH